MELIIELGCTGIGLIWGWWIGNLGGRVTRPLLDGLMLGLASLLITIEIFILTSWWALIFFFGAGGLALTLHLEWRKELIDRFGAPRL